MDVYGQICSSNFHHLETDAPNTPQNLVMFRRSTFQLRRINYHRSISPTFYRQLLRTQILKAQKDSQFKQLFALLGSAGVKAACEHVDEIDPMSRLVVLRVQSVAENIGNPYQ